MIGDPLYLGGGTRSGGNATVPPDAPLGAQAFVDAAYQGIIIQPGGFVGGRIPFISDYANLYLSGFGFTSVAFGALASVGSNAVITLDGNQLASADFGALVSVGISAIISLSGNQLASADFGALTTLSSNASLSLSGNQLASVGFGALASVGSNAILALDGNPLTQPPDLSALTSFGGTLSLPYCQLDSAGVDAFLIQIAPAVQSNAYIDVSGQQPSGAPPTSASSDARVQIIATGATLITD